LEKQKRLIQLLNPDAFLEGEDVADLNRLLG